MVIMIWSWVVVIVELIAGPIDCEQRRENLRLHYLKMVPN
jgi:hypothetical protein